MIFTFANVLDVILEIKPNENLSKDLYANASSI